tara:strand:- start:812 stop:1081 length:270 start_codon:yes stop_codon:yes gene_type:complete
VVVEDAPETPLFPAAVAALAIIYYRDVALVSLLADKPSDWTCLPASKGLNTFNVSEPTPPLIPLAAEIVLFVETPGLTDIVYLKQFGFQ